MILLLPTRLHWINDSSDDPCDLCAHSPVLFQIGEESLIRPEDGVWTVSAAALYLLRTLSQSHINSQRVAEHLFPCCGNGIFEVEDNDDVLILGCNSGIDFQIIQNGSCVEINTMHHDRYHVSLTEWKKAICAFSDSVWDFYESSSPKIQEGNFERRSYARFMSEWPRRRLLADV